MKIFGRKGEFTSALAMACVLTFGSGAVGAPVTVGGLYTENARLGCGTGTTCQLVFTGVPNGKQLSVQRLSCAITEQENRLAFVMFCVRKSDGSITREAFLPAQLMGATTGFFRHVVNSEVDLITRGSPPMLEVVSDLVVTITVNCQISGRLTNLLD